MTLIFQTKSQCVTPPSSTTVGHTSLKSDFGREGGTSCWSRGRGDGRTQTVAWSDKGKWPAVAKKAEVTNCGGRDEVANRTQKIKEIANRCGKGACGKSWKDQQIHNVSKTFCLLFKTNSKFRSSKAHAHHWYL